MAKTAEKTAEFIENVEFPSFDASKATDQIRAFAEKGVEQSKEAYAKLKTGAEEAQKALETTFETAKTVSSDLSLKTISAFRANAEVRLRPSRSAGRRQVALRSRSSCRPRSCASASRRASSRPRISRPSPARPPRRSPRR